MLKPTLIKVVSAFRKGSFTHHIHIFTVIKYIKNFHAFFTYTHPPVASFPGLTPSFCRFSYCKRQKLGMRPGNEATLPTFFTLMYLADSGGGSMEPPFHTKALLIM